MRRQRVTQSFCAVVIRLYGNMMIECCLNSRMPTSFMLRASGDVMKMMAVCEMGSVLILECRVDPAPSPEGYVWRSVMVLQVYAMIGPSCSTVAKWASISCSHVVSMVVSWVVGGVLSA